MSTTIDELLDQALSLPVESRAELTEKLLASIEGWEREEVDAAWAEEIERRIDAIDRGDGTARPASEVLNEICGRSGPR